MKRFAQSLGRGLIGGPGAACDLIFSGSVRKGRWRLSLRSERSFRASCVSSRRRAWIRSSDEGFFTNSVAGDYSVAPSSSDARFKAGLMPEQIADWRAGPCVATGRLGCEIDRTKKRPVYLRPAAGCEVV